MPFAYLSLVFSIDILSVMFMYRYFRGNEKIEIKKVILNKWFFVEMPFMSDYLFLHLKHET